MRLFCSNLLNARRLHGLLTAVSSILVVSVRSMSTIPKGVFSGSGVQGMSELRNAQRILSLCTTKQEAKAPPNVLYLGTAIYDIAQFATKQTQRLKELGCQITILNLVDEAPSPATISSTIAEADIILVSGGNTLFAVDRWNRLGVAECLRKNCKPDVVLTGGSAGAICWFDGGHSDSMDPDSYKVAMQEKFAESGSETTVTAENSGLGDETKDWKYIRVPGLGIFPGLMCPHHDQTQSNGVLRAHDFDQMMLKHPGEIGIGLDHWCALVSEGDDNYSVLSLEGKPGSVVYDDDGTPSFSPEAKGVPGIWIKQVVEKEDGTKVVQSRLCPPKGKLSDILKPATQIVQDEQDMEQCRRDNADDGPVHA